MIKEAYGYGASVDEAKEKALSELNARPDDDIQFEVIDMPKAKTLGIFGGKPAKVRVYVELPDPKPAKQKKTAPDNIAKPQREVKSEKPVKPVKNDKAPVREPQERKSEPAAEYADAVPASDIAADSPAGRAVAYLCNILERLGCTGIDVKVAQRENGATIILSGNGLGVVIGRRGETLDSLQYLTSLAANSGNGYFKVSLNIGNYREKREQTLTALAKRVSAQVISTSRSRSLEPMNPYERRIIHTAVQDIEGVTSGSVGEGSSRRVVISPVGGTAKRSDGNSSSRPAAASSSERAPRKDAESAPLYGKIK